MDSIPGTGHGNIGESVKKSLVNDYKNLSYEERLKRCGWKSLSELQHPGMESISETGHGKTEKLQRRAT